MHVDRIVASLTVAACLGMASVASGQAPAFTGPLPYQGIADSPFFSSGQVCYALETFPQGAISVPGFSFSPNGAAIVPGVGVPPGGFVLQASGLGVIEMNFAPDASTGQYPTQVGFIWTGGGTPAIGAQLTVTVISGGSQAVSQQYSNLPYNDPANPADNSFFGVTWSTGVQQVRLAFNPFSPTIPNQVDDIQFSLASKVTAIEPASASYDAAGGTGSSAVTLNGAGCGWTAITTDPWISITSGSGFGNGTVQYSVAANTGAARTGSISVSGTGGGLSISIAQAASGECAITGISPTSASASAAGGPGSFAVTVSNATCTWSASTGDAWITLTTGSGTGDGTVAYTVAGNTSTDARTGTISVGGFAFTVTQSGVPCAVTAINPTSATATAAGGPGSFAVTTNGATCAWSATTGDAWITLTTASGTGNGNVGYSVAENSTTIARSGTITVEGLTFTVTQSGVPCAVTAINPTSATATAAGGPGSFTVTTNGAECGWSASTSDAWITLTTGSGTGNGTVGYTVAPNPGAERTGTISVGGFAFTVTQQAGEVPCSVVGIAPTSTTVPSAGASGSFAVTMSGPTCPWSASTGDAWITLATASGTGNGTVGYSVAENTSTDARTGTISVGGFAFTVTQSGVPCAVTAINPTSATATAAGGPGSFAVTTNGAECGWSASTSDAWITLTTASGTGNGTVGYTVAENTSTDARTGTISVGGLAFTVTQSGVPCAVTAINPTSATATAAGGPGSFAVTTNGATCAWSATTGDAWITLTTASGTGNGTVGYTVAGNTSTVARTGIISVGGLAFTVTQDGAACAVVEISPTSASYAPAADTGSFLVTTNGSTCPWSASTTDPWITVTTPSGTGSSLVEYAVAENTGAESRTGTITVGGLDFTITQSSPQAAVFVIPDQPYLSLTDSPFFGQGISCFEVEFYPSGGTAVDGVTYAPGEIVPGVGVAPGGFVLQSVGGQVGFTIDAAIAAGGQPPMAVGIVYTGGPVSSATVTVTDPNGVQAIAVLPLTANDPTNPSDNQFVGVEWFNGVSQIAVSFDPPGGTYQFDQLQFNLPSAFCQTGQPDFNGDGWNDLVVQNPSTGETGVQLLLDGEAAGYLSTGQTAGAEWRARALGFWGQGAPGRPSICFRSEVSGIVGNWLLDGPDFTSAYVVSPTVSLAWRVSASGDFDLDGIDDIVWQNLSTGQTGVWYFGANGQPVSFVSMPTQPPAGWLCEGSADFNDDGRADLLWRNQTSGQMGVWYLGGADGLAIQNIGLVATAGSPSWAIVGLSDLNSDGVPDLLWQQINGGTFGVWYMGFDPQSFGLSVTAIELPTLGVSNAWRIRG